MERQLRASLSALRHYCTYFDRHYLVQGLTLYRSLSRHAGPFSLSVLCLDDECYALLTRLALPGVRAVPLAELEAADPELRAAKGNRSRVEYYFTLTPAWPRYLLESSDIEMITYLDSDLLFYSSPEPVFEELGDASVLIIGHRFPQSLRHLEQHGVYNVGFLSFRNDVNGKRCLERWRRQCLDWCYDRVEEGKFADQKYLDDWPATLPGVHVLEHKGAGVAPWNWMNYRLWVNGDTGTVDDEPLIYFHFQGMKIVNPWIFRVSDPTYGPMPRGLVRRLYGGYLRELSATRRWFRSAVPGAELLTGGGLRYSASTYRQIISELRRGLMYFRLGSLPL